MKPRAIAIIAAVMSLAACDWANAQQALDVSLEAQCSGNISPVDCTLTWSAPGALSCTASGGWNGPKDAAGSEVVRNVRAPGATFRLDCVGEEQGTSSAVVSWTPPTTNTDGSPYTNPRGFTIHYGESPDGLAETVGFFEPTGTSYTVPDLEPGTWHFCVRAVNTRDISSECSEIASTTIAPQPAPTGSAVQQVEVNTKPNPPTAVTVSSE